MDDAKLEKLFETLATAVARVDQQLAEARSDIRVLKSDGATLKTDIATLQRDVARIEANVVALKADVTVLKVGYGELKFEQAKTIIKLSELQSETMNFKTEFLGYKEIMLSTVDHVLKDYRNFISEKTAIDVALRRHDDEMRLLQIVDEKMLNEIAQLRA